MAVIGGDLTLALILQESSEITIISTHNLADVIYFSEINENTQNIIQQALISGKHLIIERNRNSESMIEKCQASGVLLAIVERSDNNLNLFKSVNYYESNLSPSLDIQKIIINLNFLVNNTQKDKFKVFSLKS